MPAELDVLLITRGGGTSSVATLYRNTRVVCGKGKALETDASESRFESTKCILLVTYT